MLRLFSSREEVSHHAYEASPAHVRALAASGDPTSVRLVIGLSKASATKI
jgi:hypothetical protein